MKNIYFLLVAFMVTSLSFGQTEIFNAAGGGAYPSAGWSDMNNVTTNLIDRGSYYLIDAGAPSDVITTDTYDLSSYGSAEIKFDIKSFGSGTHNSVLTEISYDGGTTYAETDTSVVTTGSYTTYTYSLVSVSNQVKVRFSTAATSGRGIRFRNIILEALGVDPVISITAPTDNAILASGTTSVDVNVLVQNFVVGNPGAGIDGHIHWTINTNGAGEVAQPMKYNTNPETITVTDGSTYVVVMKLVDNSDADLIPGVQTMVTFSVAYPCDLMLGAITTTCDAETAGVDTYTTTIDFTGGGTSTYTIDTGGVGTVGGDNPSAMAMGTITITNVNEGTDFTVNMAGDASNSSCDINRNITSPICVATTCAAVGSIIVTEIMKNPGAVADSMGEYFEVYNTTGAAIDMQGWVIGDEGSDSHTIASSVIVPSMGYVVFGINSNSGTNGGITVDYQYTGIAMSNGTDEVEVACSGTVIDVVAYSDATFPDTSGAAMELSSDKLNSTDNNDGANWGNATNDIGAGDFGTPGSANDFLLSIADNTIEGFGIYPNPANNVITITTRANQVKNVTIFNILGKKVMDATVSNTLNVSSLQAGVYIVKVTENNITATKKLIIK